jgi:CBS domain-containing protein
VLSRVDGMLVNEVMTKKIITINPDDTVFNACQKYHTNHIGCLIVSEKESCVGIVTERDIIKKMICDYKDSKKTKVSEIMSADVITIQSLETLEKALKLMKKYKIKKLPVVSNNILVGIITLSDIAHARPELTKRFIDSWVRPRWDDEI